jgi:CRISPR-associated protein Cas2
MFDLSVGTKQQSRAATKFREFLLVQRLEMSQLSGKDSYESHLHTIEGNIPEKGDIHVLSFTDEQYENIVLFSSKRRKRR